MMESEVVNGGDRESVERERTLLHERWRDAVAGGAALLLAGGTLLCCALPILLVSLGLGATVAALTSSLPWLVALSQYKAGMFIGAAVVLVVTAMLVWRPGRACPSDPELARVCARADRWNRRMLWAAAAIWMAGFFMAYAWLPVWQWFAE